MASEYSPAKMDQHRLSVSGIKSAKYTLYEGQTAMSEFTREELGRGIDVTRLEKLSINQDGEKLRKAIHDQTTTLGDAWRTQVGHKRPGVGMGLPMDQAAERAAGLGKVIAELIKPVELQVRLVPVQ